MGKRIVDFPPYSAAVDNDIIPIWDSTKLITKSISKANLLANLITSNSSVLGWQYVSASSSVVSFPCKILIANTSSDITISVAQNPTAGSELEIKLLSATGNVYLTNISTLNGVTVPSTNKIKVIYSSTSTVRMIYVNSTYGWLAVPQNLIVVSYPLNLPTTGLIQKFYAAEISGVANGGILSQWTDTVSGKNATQSIIANQPTFNSNIFNSFLPSVYFSGSQYFSTDLSYLSGVKYTIAIVEARANFDSNPNYFIGQDNSSTNQALQVGYRGDTTFTLAQFSNDLNATVLGYSTFKPNIWIVSNNSRGKEIWLNSNKIASGSDTNNLSSGTNGRIGRAINTNCIGHLGLIATYTGDKSTSDIAAIFAAINNTFAVY